MSNGITRVDYLAATMKRPSDENPKYCIWLLFHLGWLV